MITLRYAKISDAKDLGYIHYQTWIDTYTGLIDQEILDNMSIAKSVKIFLNTLCKNTIVASLNDRVIGFVKAFPYRFEGFTGGEVGALYVLKEYQKIGVGKMLMDAALKTLKEFRHVALWVLDNNQNAIDFYMHMGFRFDGEKMTSKASGHEINERRMVITNEVKVIHILGASGSGTSSFGRAIAEKYGYTFLDSDDYFWEEANPPFTVKREFSERIRLLKNDIMKYDKVVLSGSLVKWGDSLIPYFDLIILLDTKTELRIERIEAREHERFGSRIDEGGDMYEAHLAFIEWAKKYDDGDLTIRSKALHNAWLKNIVCAKETIDGSKDMNEKLEAISKYLK